MVYFDNAATTKNKPQEVYDAAFEYMKDVGVSPGRGSYQLGIEASRRLYRTRCTVGKHFGLSEPDRVIFTKNSTEAINLLFNGLFQEGDHVIISCFEHNAVLRPLETLKRIGLIDYSVVRTDDLALSPEVIYDKYATKKTRLIGFTLASNLTGRIVFREDIFKFFKEKGVRTFVDASQGGGKILLSMKEQGIDYLAFTGHKDLLVLPGVGGLCCESKELPKPLIQGGTGIHGDEYVNPDIFPEGYEAGTINMPAICSLKAGLSFIERERISIIQKEKELITLLIRELDKIDPVIIYDHDVDRVSTFCFNVKGVPSDQVVAFLDKKGICVRGGIHCAILAHEAINTVQTGAVRVSLNYQNTAEEVGLFIEAIKELCG